MKRVTIATAGWTVTRDAAPRFPPQGTHLSRYAQVFSGVEINSSFYRPHAAGTYQKWAECTPDAFRFAIKMPGAITHEQALRGSRAALRRFYEEISGLGRKRGPVLVQLPASHIFDRRVAGRFLACLRDIDRGSVVIEPRHASWFTVAADRLLSNYRVARAAADPICCPGAGLPGGWTGLVYYRLHGTPRMYWSRYTSEYLEALLETLLGHARTTSHVWCVFDNTAWGGAILNAVELEDLAVSLRRSTRSARRPRSAPRQGRSSS